jgi:N6-adenosine-specific RNA methylase IME4
MSHSLTTRDPIVIKLEAARAALSEATDLSEVKHIVDVAAAAEIYAKRQKLGEEAEHFAHRIKIEALSRLGELLRDMPKATGGQPYQTATGTRLEPVEKPVLTLADLGIDKKVSSVAQQLAKLEPELRDAVASKERTLVEVRREQKERQREERRAENRAKVEQAEDLSPPANVRYATIVIDPPWDFREEGDDDVFGRTRPTYAQMTETQLAALPVAELADVDCHLYLWITNRSLMTGKGWRLCEAWGFRPATLITWCKPSIGVGNYFRNNTEHLLFAVRGQQPLVRRDIGTWFTAPRGPDGHSSKPDEAYTLIQSCSPGPYLDVFARRNRTGWSVWGAEADNGV